MLKGIVIFLLGIGVGCLILFFYLGKPNIDGLNQCSFESNTFPPSKDGGF